ncbi:PHP domain-containing protein [Hornefia butyriciproducens]|uniref:PHP domain-containing protein n=1 Tax=Hornefia butyriciproducens TaxID=2652293 RepID=UPI002A764190|nr:PHP domain-containing protein [Hornefia butyriciproducens]MCI7327443.1 PHP domain-containing protein [Clostridiales bacterium]MDY2989895.1 PHP domain-containing protein [Hornefia butyriciproducens]
MGLKMDLHIHSTCSDGTMTPVELVRKYYQEEYGLIALTDHDGIDGVKTAQIAGEALGISVISGIELGTELPDGPELHILGYYIDIGNPELNETLAELRKTRSERNRKLLDVLRSMGYDLTEEDLKQRPDQVYVGKPNFALALQKKGYVKSPEDAFAPGKFLESPEAKAVRRERITAQKAIELINGAGGIASLAHPMKIKGIGEKGSEDFFHRLEEIVKQLKKAGLKGLECFHPSATHEQGIALVKLAEKYKLHVTEGSDYHGPEFEPHQ